MGWVGRGWSGLCMSWPEYGCARHKLVWAWGGLAMGQSTHGLGIGRADHSLDMTCRLHGPG
jgi:hypothetical protein